VGYAGLKPSIVERSKLRGQIDYNTKLLFRTFKRQYLSEFFTWFPEGRGGYWVKAIPAD
jgi:hypothetical protein